MLPDFTILHKQDWYVTERYRPKPAEGQPTLLARASDLRFNERPFLNHSCYLFITKTSKERIRQESTFNTLCRPFLLPQEITDPDAAAAFLDAVEQFESIVNESGLVRLHRLTEEEIVGTKDKSGVIEKYLTLSQSDTYVLQDMTLDSGSMKVGDKQLCLHTLSDLDALPAQVTTDDRYERLSTDRSDCRLSYAAPIGLLLSCDHIYNQYVLIENSAENLRKLERTARNMNSLSRYSRSNAINQEWIEEYLNEAHTNGLLSIKAHFNVFAWTEDAGKLKAIRNRVGAQLAQMECKPHYNTVDVPALFWAGIPGNAADLPAEEAFYTFPEPALCFFAEETCGRDSPAPFGIRMVDRLSGKPV